VNPINEVLSPEYATGFVNREPDEKLITEEKI
jgi:hypothetical protein